ncbi:hypothetical protein [Pseudoxanthomonas wuyuanensis]
MTRNESRTAFLQRGLASLGALLLLAGLFSACKSPAEASPAFEEATSAVEKIEIRYQYSGWEFVDDRYLITPHGAGFIILPNTAGERGDGRQPDMRTGKAVPSAQIQRLLEAWDAPAVPREQGLHAVAATVSSRSLAKAFEKEAAIWKPECDAQVQQRYKRQLTNAGVTYRLLDGYYGNGIRWTDDYPDILIRIHRKDQAVATIHSNAQQDLMLPWRRNEVETWDPGLSKAVVGLLPATSHVHRRLSGDSLVGAIARDAAFELSRLCRGSAN